MKLHILFALIALPILKLAHAEPFINTQDLHLKANLQHLKNASLLDAPINTYPLMWVDINRSLNKINLSQLSPSEYDSYQQIKNAYQKAKRKELKLSANAASSAKRFTSFGDDYRNKNNITLSASSVSDYIAYKLSPTLTTSSIDGDRFQLNDSYVALRLGNWNFSLGTQDRWWGPGWDSNIGLTNNARPMISAAVTRNVSLPLTIPFTDNYQIPWNVTSFMGKMEEDRHISDTLLWGFRFTFIPIENLEISLIRLAQWGGDGRSKSLSTFVDLFLGKDNCGIDGLDCGANKENEPGNQQAGYDLRYSFQLFNTPMSFYGQYFGEDGDASGGINFITKPAVQVGFDGQINLFSQTTTVFIEYTDTYKTCGKNEVVGNCFFEHHIYQTGMRYKKRNIGHLYDNDAESIVLGLIGQTENGLKWDTRLRYIQLNQDDSDRYPNDPNKGNTVTKVAEDLLMLSANATKRIDNISYKIGAEFSQSKYTQKDDEYDSNVSFSLNYHF